MRLHVEQAMADAVKRVCPHCNLAFIKSDGCNHLICPCGYTLCYVCRMDIRKEGYQHFCKHFRQIPGACRECSKCDLYKIEPESLTLRKAAALAKSDFALRSNETYMTSGWDWLKDQIWFRKVVHWLALFME